MWGRPPSSSSSSSPSSSSTNANARKERGGGGRGGEHRIPPPSYHRRPASRATTIKPKTFEKRKSQLNTLPPKTPPGRSKTSLSLHENQTRGSRERAMRALMSTNNNNNTTSSSNKTTTTTTTKTRNQLQPPQRAQSTIGVPPRQKKNDSLLPPKQHPSSRFGGGARLPPPPPPSQKREVTTKQRSTNGRETAPPIAPRLKPREPPVLAKYPPTATAAQGRKRGDQRVLVRGGPARTKTPSSSLLVTSTSTAAGGRKMTRTTTMTTSTVFGRQNGTEKQRQETIGTSELELEKQLKKKIEETNASPGRKRTLCKEAFDDVVQKSNLFRGRLELIRDVIFNDNTNAEDENDENETKVVKCLVCAENTPTIQTLEDSLRIEKLERSNAKRENANAMKTIAELRADVTQLGKIISRVFRNEIKPNELKEIAARFREAAASSASSASEDKNESEEEDDDEEDNQWTPLPKTSQFYGLPVEEISWGRTLTPRVMSPGYPVPKLDFSFVTNSVDAEDEDSFCRESASSSVVSDDSFYDDQEEEEDDDDDDTVVNNNNNAEKGKEDDDDDDDDDDDEDAEVDRWLNS